MIKKISYERRVYESVDDNSLSKAISQKTDEKNKSCNKGLNKMRATFDRNIDFKIRRDDQKKSYERRVYESVDDNSLSKAISQKLTKEINHATKC